MADQDNRTEEQIVVINDHDPHYPEESSKRRVMIVSESLAKMMSGVETKLDEKKTYAELLGLHTPPKYRKWNWGREYLTGEELARSYEAVRPMDAETTIHKEADMSAATTLPVAFPTLIDDKRELFRWKCPTCQTLSTTRMGCTHQRLPATADLKCGNGHIIRLTFWIGVGIEKKPSCSKLGEIPIMARHDCPECKGTGEYVGFNSTSLCSVCPKG